VVVSIKPLHSLVAAVMEGDGEPLLLVSGQSSPHEFQLKPSQAEALKQAQLVFYIGDTMETFLTPMLSTLPEETQIVAMEEQPGMFLLPARRGRDAEEESGYIDPHLWLDPANAIAMVDVIAEYLSRAFPEHETLYRDNATQLKEHLSRLDDDLRARLGPLSGRPFVAMHDAYQYFEHAYGLHSAGFITQIPGQMSGARRLEGLRQRMENEAVQCVFKEPQPAGGVAETLAREEGAHAEMLDPEGMLLPPGPELYFQLMQRMADAFESCLGQ
jgi:zinc transport system substrate-binding protein